MRNLAQDENLHVPPVSESSGGGAPDPRGAAKRNGVAPEDEERLIEACKGGDLGAFDKLILRYQDVVYGVAFQLLRDREDAEDVAQEVFLSCFRNIGAFRFESRFSTWIYRVTVNRVKNRWKYLQRRQSGKHVSLDAPTSQDDPRPTELPDPRSDPRREAEGRQTMEMLNAAVGTLPMEYQEVLALRFVRNLQYEEIAAVLGCSLGTVKSRINRARCQLREKMRDALD